ncbi:MAG TPA: hypothetical protein VK974_04660 [Methylophilaceae bacterium]|nr:hypothetical protein [Methylophilaceae bacterium]
MLFIMIDENGEVESSHNDDTIKTLPAGAVEIVSQQEWNDRLEYTYSTKGKRTKKNEGANS